VRLLVENIKSSVKLIIDTSTFFSAIYNRHGNEAKLFELADKSKCSIFIVDHVLDEMENIFERKYLDFTLVLELLDTYNNIEIHKLSNLTRKEIELAQDLILKIDLCLFSR
jgi:predicted nucleic acid-binding protein